MQYLKRFGRFAAMLAVAAIPLCAQIDTSSITNQANSLVTLFVYIAAVGCVAALAFGIFKLVGRDIGAGIGWILGAIVAGYIIGHAISWTSTMTGVTVGQ